MVEVHLSFVLDHALLHPLMFVSYHLFEVLEADALAGHLELLHLVIACAAAVATIMSLPVIVQGRGAIHHLRVVVEILSQVVEDVLQVETRFLLNLLLKDGLGSFHLLLSLLVILTVLRVQELRITTFDFLVVL